ncbi:MAG: deoxyribonuclease IV [Mycoplasma sp.]|nr:deoxyribonuclease IV [Mycoplasma sp.]
MLKIGSYVAFKNPSYLLGALEESLSYQANAMMIYLGSPQYLKRIVPISSYKLDEYLKHKDHFPLENIVIHAPYVINPASPKLAKKAELFLIEEIEKINYLKAKYLILHPGFSTIYDVSQAIETLIITLKNILASTKDVTILLETMSGKSSQVGSDFGQLSYIIKKVNSKRIGICFDTCHVWDSGYDLTNTNQLISDLGKYDLLDKIKVFHINDSKYELGSKKDRHANLKKGKIPFKAIHQIVHNPIFKDSIFILETPIKDGNFYKEEIAILREKLI